MSTDPKVVHPEHYNKTLYETWEVLDVWHSNPLLWNAGKYLARAEHAGNQIRDLEKAVNYINRRIGQLKKAQSPGTEQCKYCGLVREKNTVTLAPCPYRTLAEDHFFEPRR